MSIISGKKPDHAAFAMTLSLYGARLIDCPLDEYFSDSSRYVEGQMSILDTFHPDVLFGPFDFAQLGAAFGSTIKKFSDQAPTLRKPVVDSLEDLEHLSFPDPDNNPYLLYQQESIADLAKKSGRDTPIAAILPLSIDFPSLILGMNGWMETILFNQQGTRQVLDLINPFLVDYANRLYAKGADFIVSPCAFSSPSLVTRDIVTKFSRPALLEILRQLKGPVVLHHGGAPVLSNLDLLTDLPCVIGYVVDARDDMTKAREILGPDPVLFGGPDNLSLPSLPCEKVMEWCRRVLLDRIDDPRFVLCNSGPDVPLCTPPEVIHAFRIAAKEHAG